MYLYHRQNTIAPQISKQQMQNHSMTLTYEDKMNLSSTTYSHPPKDSLKSIKLRNLLLKIGYFNTPSTTQDTVIHYNDTHIQEAQDMINDLDITPKQREILLLLIKRT